MEEASSHLERAFGEFKRAWDQTSNQWQDAAARSFHAQYLTPIIEGTEAFLEELREISAVVAQARNQVE